MRKRSSKRLAELCGKLALEKKGENVKILDLRELTSIADYFVIISGETPVHLKAIADYIEDKIKEKRNEIVWHREGEEGSRWILLDYVDVVVHIFTPETRDYYGIESFWGDAPFKEILYATRSCRTIKKKD